MSAAIVPFPRALPLAERKPVDPFDLLPTFAKDEANRRLQVIAPVLEAMNRGASIRACANAALTKHAANTGEELSLPTVMRWLKQYREGGLVCLAPRYKGRERDTYGWEARAVELYNKPTRPAYSTVALWLRQEGYASAADHLVRAYLKSAPSNVTETGKKRLGEHYYNQNIRPHIVRDSKALPVGFVYQGDGHRCDVYVATPATGNPYHPELTIWIDVRSHYVVGWWLSESESAITTLYSFSNALLAQDHAPALVHTDPGSGFTARVISDAQTGFFQRFSIEMIEALPGNARGKGLVEGWFRWFEERLGKRFQTFCGHCRTDDELRALTQKVRRGDIRLPTLAEYMAAIKEYVRFYNSNPQEELDGLAPQQLWATLERVPLETPANAIMRPRRTSTVKSWGVRLHNRHYRAAELQAYETRDVVVEYDLHDDSFVRIFDDKGRFVCEASLVEKAPWLPASRIEEAQAKRLAGQQKRLQIKLDEASARATTPLSAVAALAVLEQHHSFSVPSVMPPQRASKPVNEAELDAVRATIADAETPASESPEQRFTRALGLQRRREAGLAISTEDNRWLDAYSTSAECQGLADIYQAFGYLPGVNPETNEGPAGTGPSGAA